MTPDVIYKTILASITQVRNVRNRGELEEHPGVFSTTLADDSLLDEMARNSAQALVGSLGDVEHCGGCSQCQGEKPDEWFEVGRARGDK